MKPHRKTAPRGLTQCRQALTAALAVLFVALQLTSLAHSAEHKFEHHEHDGIDCALSIFCDRLGNADLPAPNDLSAPVGTADHAHQIIASQKIAPVYRRNARAPPSHA